jgi:hypothetical protein
MACFLPSKYNFFCVLARSRYKFDRRTRYSPGRQSSERALAQCRGRSCLEARNLSQCRILIVCSCACPGAGLSTGLGKWLRVMQKA